MSDVAIAQQQQPAKPKRSAKSPTRLTKLQREAVDLMVWEGMTYQEAAAAIGMSARYMRLALGKPHVLAHMKAELEVLRGSERPRNIHRARAIRDAAQNMPAMHAIKFLEGIGVAADSRSSNAPNVPGFAIVIVNQASAETPHYQQIEAKPLQTNTFGPDGVGRDE